MGVSRWREQTHRQTHRRTWRLYDQLWPSGAELVKMNSPKKITDFFVETVLSQATIRNTFFDQRSPRPPEVGVLRWRRQTDGHGNSMTDPAQRAKSRKNSTKNSRIRETPTLSTDADSRTDTNLKRLRDLSKKFPHTGDTNSLDRCGY